MNKKKLAFVTFSSKYLKIKTNPTYKEFISLIKKLGFEILHEWYFKKEERTPELIYSQSLKSIREANYLIVEASIDSIGVGQQITYALQKKKHVLICIKKSRFSKNNLNFLKGTKSGNIKFIYYKGLNDLEEQLKAIFSNKEDQKLEKLEKFNFVSTSRIKSIILEESKKQQISQSELLRNIIEEWIANNLKK
jgi:hypothetical protein